MLTRSRSACARVRNPRLNGVLRIGVSADSSPGPGGYGCRRRTSGPRYRTPPPANGNRDRERSKPWQHEGRCSRRHRPARWLGTPRTRHTAVRVTAESRGRHRDVDTHDGHLESSSSRCVVSAVGIASASACVVDPSATMTSSFCQAEDSCTSSSTLTLAGPRRSMARTP